MNSNGSKFYPKSLTLLVSILEFVKEATIAADIARNLNLNKSHVSYYINKAKNMGLLNQVTRDAFTVLELTQAGKSFLDQYHKNNNAPWLHVRAENIQFRAEITRMPTIPVDWKKVEMNNWPQYKSHTDGIKLKLNMGKKPTLYFLPTPLGGKDPYEIFVKMVFECVNVILDLNKKTGLEVGPLQLGSRGEWLVYDPVARDFSKINGQVTYDGIAKVNASRPASIGEFEFFDPRVLLNYLMMPPRVQAIDSRTEAIYSLLQNIVQKLQTCTTQNELRIMGYYTTIFSGSTGFGALPFII